jgi:anti-sigma regulatory factor (Ser/Thr protein kinase)
MSATESSTNGGAPLSRATPAAPDGKRDAVIEGLTLALGRLRRGAAALKAENDELRAEISGLQPATPSRRGDAAPIHQFGMLAEIALPTGSAAPGAARMVVAHCLNGLVSQQILLDAQLLVSEVVTNSLRHGELTDGDTVLVRVYLAADSLRLEIANRGTAGAVNTRQPDRRSRGGGFGLHLVDHLTASWGVWRNDGTNVWFEMARA